MFNRGRAQKSCSFSKLSCIGLSSSGATLASDAYSGLTMNLMKPICECGREWPSREKPGETGKLSAASASPCAHGGRVRWSYGTGGGVERRAQGAQARAARGWSTMARRVTCAKNSSSTRSVHTWT